MSKNPPRLNRRYSDNPTAGYRSQGVGYSLVMAGQMAAEPWFTWMSVPLMCRDNAVKYGLKQLRTPYQKIDIAKDDAGKYKIAAKPEVARYILKTWRTFWRKSLPKLLENYNKWGRAPGGVEWLYDKRRRRLTLDQVRAIDPFDANPWVYSSGRRANQFCGFDLRMHGSGVGGRVFVSNPHAFFFAGNEAFGAFCDEPALAAAFVSWQEKNAPMGLRSSRRLQAWTKSVGITVIRHPNEMITLRDGRQVHSEELATQLGNVLMNGAVVGMPSDMIPDSSGLRRWDIDQRTAAQGEVKTGELVKDADAEIWFGMGIPPEIIRAGDTGSGYSGRAVPMECWLGGIDEGGGLWDRTFRTQVLEPGMRANYGRVDPYDYELKSLLGEYLESQKNAPQQSQPGQGGQQGSDWQTVGTTQTGHQKQQNGSGQTRYLSEAVREVVREAAREAALETYADAVSRPDRSVHLSAIPQNKLTRLDQRLRLAAALAMIGHRLDDLEGRRTGSPNDQGVWDSLAELADDPDEVAKALGSVNLSWVAYGTSKSGKPRWKNEDTKQVRYQQTRPGSVTDARRRNAASTSRGHEIIDKLHGGAASADDLRELSDHLPAMTRQHLVAARQKLGARFGSAKTRDQMVEALRQHVHGKAAESGKAVPGQTLREDSTPADPKVEDVHTVPTTSLKRRPEQMQYKVTGIGSEGVGDELKGVEKYDPKLGGTLLVWRDPETGEDVVVNGHHRHHLAERTGAPTVNARYIDAPTAKEARSMGALANIAEGRGSAVDAAKYLRDSGNDVGHLQRAGVSLSGRVAADAVHLTKLSDPLFDKVAREEIPEAHAVAIGKHLHDHGLQDLLVKKVKAREDDGKDWGPKEIEQAARKMAAAGKVTEKGTDLFGDFEDEKSTFDQEVELEHHVGRQLAQQVNDFGAVSSTARAGRVAGAGNVLATEENRKRKEAAQIDQETFDRLQHRSGPIAEAVKAGAAELAAAKTKKEKDLVKAHTVERVRAAIQAVHNPPKPERKPDPEPGPAVAPDGGGAVTGGSQESGTEALGGTGGEVDDGPTVYKKIGGRPIEHGGRPVRHGDVLVHTAHDGRERLAVVGNAYDDTSTAADGSNRDRVTVNPSMETRLHGFSHPGNLVGLADTRRATADDVKRIAAKDGATVPAELLDPKRLGESAKPHPPAHGKYGDPHGAPRENRSVTVKHENDEAKALVPQVVGKELPEHVLASLGSAVDGGSVEVQDAWTTGPDGKPKSNGFYLVGEGGGVSSFRHVYRNEDDGKLVLDNSSFRVAKDQRQGTASRVFAEQVRAARAAGVDRIEAYAAGSHADATHPDPDMRTNGYVTWPKLGYDGQIPPSVWEAAPPELREAAGPDKSVLSLVQAPGGADWWFKNGRGFLATFDPSDGSPSMKQLDKYLKERAVRDGG